MIGSSIVGSILSARQQSQAIGMAQQQSTEAYWAARQQQISGILSTPSYSTQRNHDQSCAYCDSVGELKTNCRNCGAPLN